LARVCLGEEVDLLGLFFAMGAPQWSSFARRFAVRDVSADDRQPDAAIDANNSQLQDMVSAGRGPPNF
jgi:hypothetical protein